MKKERPILFSTPMVNAILLGNKTQTRRTKGLETPNKNPDDCKHIYITEENNTFVYAFQNELKQTCGAKCPYGKEGDILWVRETIGIYKGAQEPVDTVVYKSNNFCKDYPQNIYDPSSGLILSEWYDEALASEVRWTPSIHMKKEYARIWLEITNIKAERLQSILLADMKAEGVSVPVAENGNMLLVLGEDNNALQFLPKYGRPTNYTEEEMFFAHWAELWCKVNGRDSWNHNPWVWVIDFKRIEKPFNA